MDEEEKAMIAEGNAPQPDVPEAKQQAQIRVEADDDEPMRIVKDYQRPTGRYASGIFA